MAGKEKSAESTYIVQSNFFHLSRLLLRNQQVQMTPEDAAQYVADKLLKPAK
jgi:hypothetical protein